MAKEGKTAQRAICKNRRALHDYQIQDRIEAGIVLRGSEVKSCRNGRVSLNEAYIRVINNEAFLVGGHIAEYAAANRFNHDPVRDRKLLLHRREIDKLEVRLRQQGQTAVPLSMYFKEGNVKLEIGVGKGRSHADRREVVREREMRREIDRAMKKRR